ncbi:DUF5753 domain-containing protein [Nocardiopsis alba]|uniref:DUF5753 domain-containing protein n=1 Tax=Nocardiopsis alba TaxID=53437 RepID=UPI0036919BBD
MAGKSKGNASYSGDSAGVWERFGARVRQVRTQADVDPDDLTLREVCEPTTLAAIESGEYDPPGHLARYLDSRIGAQGVLVDAWARARIQSLLDEDADISRFQHHAHQIRFFDPGAFPSPFRTPAYARALTLGAQPLSNDRTELHRAERVPLTLMGSGPPHLCLVVNASAVRETVGDSRTMADQLSLVVEVAGREHIAVHVIPEQTDLHPCRSSAFRLLSFSPHHQIVYVPAPCGSGQIITNPEQVAAHSDLFETLKGESLPRSTSLRLLKEEIDRRRSRPKALTGGDGPSQTLDVPLVSEAVRL